MAAISSSRHACKPDQDYNLLIVSDLHLSEGRHRKTKKFSRNEDFFFDEEFSRFLDYHQQHPQGNAHARFPAAHSPRVAVRRGWLT